MIGFPQTVEILSVGDEILRGAALNTNVFEIARRLTSEGWSVLRQTTLPDEPARLVRDFREAATHCRVVVVTGGVGPTLDDHSITSARVAFDQVGEPLRNRVGSCSGWYFETPDAGVFLLPGVPGEMESMLEDEVIPRLKQRYPLDVITKERVLQFAYIRESELDPLLRQLTGVEVGIYPATCSVRVSLRSSDAQALEQAVSWVRDRCVAHYLFEGGTLEEYIQSWMLQNHRTLVCAESCTGGALGAALTRVPGASQYFLGSLVTYANRLKEQILQVPHHTLQTHGAVSPETVQAMWRGAIRAAGADFGVSISGIAGPPLSDADKPVGTVHYALGFSDTTPRLGCLHLRGSRTTIIQKTVHAVLIAICAELVGKFENLAGTIYD